VSTKPGSYAAIAARFSTGLKAALYMKLAEIVYPTLVREPLPQISRIINFLGKDRLPSSEKMATVVDPTLYRKRA